MDQTFRYILKQLVISTLMTTFVLTGVIWLFVAVKVVESIINRGLSAKLFLTFTVLQLPNFLSQILPISVFVAVLYVYSRLNTDREIAVLKSVGASPFVLAKPAIFLGFIVAIIGYGLTLYGTPKTYKIFRELQWDIRYSIANIVLKEGTFNSFSEEITVYIKERVGENELRGLLVHDSRDRKKPVTYHAQSGSLIESTGSAKVVLLNGNSIFINKKNPEINRVIYFDRHILDLADVALKPNRRFREARERDLDELLNLRKEDIGNPRDYGKFKVEGHNRLAAPLNVFGFVLIALSALLTGDFSRRGQLKRIMIAAFLFVTVTAFNLGLISVSAKHLVLIPGLYITNGLIIVVATFVLLVPEPFRFFFRFRTRSSQAESSTTWN